jgi:hypothetical protein
MPVVTVVVSRAAPRSTNPPTARVCSVILSTTGGQIRQERDSQPTATVQSSFTGGFHLADIAEAIL